MSTSYSQPDLEPVWKQEVNRRLAAHRSRNGASSPAPGKPAEACHGVSSRAAQAAARVAARYANAPSFSQMQAVEAQTAVRAAEIATQVAIEAQTVAKAALASLHASRKEGSAHDPGPFPAGVPEKAFVLPMNQGAAPQSREPFDEWPNGNSREREMSVRLEVPPATGSARWDESPRSLIVDWEQLDTLGHGSPHEGELEPVEPGLPIHANLIEFPRELVAARKARPSRAEGLYPAVDEAVGQLSIFEVDPGAMPDSATTAGVPAQRATSQWSGIELEAQPIEEMEPEAQPLPVPAVLHLAPLHRRVLAALVDGTLVTAAFLAAALIAAANMEQFPATKSLEIGGVAALLLTGLVYQAIFSAMTHATPGMLYAGISLCTFDDQIPTRAQRCARLGALLLSLLPFGLGVGWSIFDEEHLSWHDRLSKTYQRRS